MYFLHKKIRWCQCQAAWWMAPWGPQFKREVIVTAHSHATRFWITWTLIDLTSTRVSVTVVAIREVSQVWFVINKLIVNALPVHEFLPAAIYGVHLYIRMFGSTLALIQALHSYDRCAIDSSKLGIAACMSILRIAPILSV